MTIKSFDEFKEQFLNWSINEIEVLQENKQHVCPYATQARKNNKIHFIDGRSDLKTQLKTFDITNEVGIVWLGNEVDNRKINKIIKDTKINNPNLVYFFSTPTTSHIKQNFTNTIVIHNKSDYLKKQRVLYETGYYDQYSKNTRIKQRVDLVYGDLYPIKKAKNQVIGTENQYKVFNQFFKEPGTLLDIGGAAGNLLHYDTNITKYSCLEVSKKAVELGKIMHPNAKFFYYDKLNHLYNPTGVVNAEFPAVGVHDFVFISSVFTSTDFNDLMYLLEKSLAVAKKRIVFSVFSNKNISLLTAFYNKFCEREITKSDMYPNKTADIRKWASSDDNIFYLVDNDSEVVNDYTVEMHGKCSSFITFYNINWLKRTLEKHFKIKIDVYDPCVSDNNFSVFVIEKE